MKVNQKCVQNMYNISAALLVLILLTFCSTPDPEFERLMTQDYARLYQFVEQRDGAAILDMTDNPDSTVRQQAWRALIQTPVEDVDLHIQKVLQSNSEEAWASLWLKPLTDLQLSYFHKLWIEEPRYKSGLVTLFAEQGNAETLDLLMAEKLGDDAEFNRNLAYAIGQRTRVIDLSEAQEMSLIDKALGTKKAELTQAYLYGYYRGRKTFSETAEQYLVNQWAEYYPDGSEGNQSLVRILMKNYTQTVLYHFDIDSYSSMNVQLAVEVAQGLAANPPVSYTPIILNTLLDHRNPNVKLAALQAIRRHPEIAERLFRDIMNKAALDVYSDPLVRMEAFNTITNPKKYRKEMLEVAGENPYLQTLKYQVLRKTDSETEFFEGLMKDLNHENRLIQFYAAQELGSWWPGVSAEFKSATGSEVKATIKELFEQKDRSISIALAPLFLDAQLYGDGDFPEINQLLAGYSLPEDVEVLQTYGQLFLSRFTNDAVDLVSAWVAQGNSALNTSLRNAGWEIPEMADQPTVFRSPDWDRLARLGPNPYLVIETRKGTITLLLDVLKAPSTISGMDSLITARAYDGTPFHRVIPNFVVQGGDVESRDGFGGPGYTVPTEASTTMYERGTVGIASAGTDTEGSQFFIMHQWKPHLNARYSAIGKVVEGMDVVDRIVQGDVIAAMYWY